MTTGMSHLFAPIVSIIGSHVPTKARAIHTHRRLCLAGLDRHNLEEPVEADEVIWVARV
jgi:hypothetical protein